MISLLHPAKNIIWLLMCLFSSVHVATAAGISNENPPMPGELAGIQQQNNDQDAINRQAVLVSNKFDSVIAGLVPETFPYAYSDQLRQAYLELGMALRNLGQYDKAARALDRALEVARKYNGLHSEQQIPVLEELRAGNEASDRWQDADDNAYLVYYITKKSYPDGDLRRIQALNQLAQTRMNIVTGEQFPSLITGISEISSYYTKETESVEKSDNCEGRNIDLANLYLGQAKLAFFLARQLHQQPLGDNLIQPQRTITQTRCRTITLPDGNTSTTCESYEVLDINSYIVPAKQKMQQVDLHLNNMQNFIVDAFEVLQEEGILTEDRDFLLAEVRQLTSEHNAFRTGDLTE